MAGVERVEVMLMRRRLRWLGHVARMEETCIPKCLLVSKSWPEASAQLVDRRGGGMM